MQLRVRANDDLLLDAGATEERGSSDIVIHPPRVTLFRQVLEYLKAKQDPVTPATGSMAENEGAAAAAVALRWGSYLAVLADRAKPVWGEARSPGTGRICDSELARINVEASAALAEWIDLCREDSGVYGQLVVRAIAYLPLPKIRARPVGAQFATLATPEVAAKLVETADASRLAAVRVDAERHPSRLFANALVNFAWSNGPVQDIHAGDFRGYPLEYRRVTGGEERSWMGFAADRLTTGMAQCHVLEQESATRTWPEQVLPYGLAGTMLITPSGWTLTEATREVRLQVR